LHLLTGKLPCVTARPSSYFLPGGSPNCAAILTNRQAIIPFAFLMRLFKCRSMAQVGGAIAT
jgi:hypothetical protein